MSHERISVGIQTFNAIALSHAAELTYYRHVQGRPIFKKQSARTAARKLTKEDAIEAKRLFYFEKVAKKDIAKKYDTTYGVVHSIIQRKAYRDCIAPFESLVKKGRKWVYEVDYNFYGEQND